MDLARGAKDARRGGRYGFCEGEWTPATAGVMDLARMDRAWGVAGAASERPQRGERRIGEPIAARGEASPRVWRVCDWR